MVAITAKFTGTDSLGFKHGHSYNLSIRPTLLNPNDVDGILIQHILSGQACEYQSWNSFTRNWKIKDIDEASLVPNYLKVLIILYLNI